MTFWTESTLDPVRKYRFRVSTPSSFSQVGGWWWAKSVDKPGYSFNTSEYQLTNHKFKFPGVLTWNDISITIIDDATDQMGSRAHSLLNNLGYIYTAPIEKTGHYDAGAKKPELGGSITDLVIEQLNGKGETIEEWTLQGVFVKAVDFGQLAYSDDELVDIKIDISYDYATLK